MSYGGFGGFGDVEESQEHDTPAFGKTPRPGMSQSGAGDRKKVRSIPVSVKVALESAFGAKDATDLPLVFDVPSKYIEVVGQLEAITVETASLSCIANDGTGSISARQYFEQSTSEAGEVNGFEDYIVGSFVRIVGALRTGNDPYISINQIKRVTSANEVSYHIINSCSSYIDIVEEKDGTFGATPLKSFNRSVLSQLNSSVKAEAQTTSEKIQEVKTTMSASAIRDNVLNFIRSGNGTQWGHSAQDVESKFRGVLQDGDIKRALEQLVDDALIYDTGDENHFKAIDG